MITIHYDFVNGTEKSYGEGHELLFEDEHASFTTNCLTFFSNSFGDNVVVIDKHGRTIDRNELMSNKGHSYTDRFMRKAHNITKMLIANSFTWKQPNLDIVGKVRIDEIFKHKDGVILGVIVLSGSVTVKNSFLFNDKYYVIKNIKRFRDDVREITSGYECGLLIESNMGNFSKGEILEIRNAI